MSDRALTWLTLAWLLLIAVLMAALWLEWIPASKNTEIGMLFGQNALIVRQMIRTKRRNRA